MSCNQAGSTILQKQQGQVKKDGEECKFENLSRKRKSTVEEEDLQNAFQVWLEDSKMKNTHRY